MSSTIRVRKVDEIFRKLRRTTENKSTRSMKLAVSQLAFMWIRRLEASTVVSAREHRLALGRVNPDDKPCRFG